MKFESAMLLLENLTPHQMEKYGEVEEALRTDQRVDIRAPAGAGTPMKFDTYSPF